MGLRDIGAELPPGFKFFPSDEELVCHYLYKKIANEDVHKGTLVEIDLHTCEPWQLPEVAKLNANEWYFFSFRDRKYATGFRTNRATISGYWKATGKDRTVHDPLTREIVGMRKTLVFYKNRAPNGVKTGWIMHEFRLETPHMPPKEDWVLCRVFHKSKEESCTQYMTLERTGSLPSTNLASSPPKQHTTFPYTHNQPLNPTSFYQNHHQNSLFHLLHLSQECKTTNNNAISEDIHHPKMDEIGFLWEDMNMEDDNNNNNNLGTDNIVSSSLGGDLRFDMDNNGMVLI